MGSFRLVMLALRLSTALTELNIHQIVNTVFTSNTYILSVEGKDGLVLIDIGDITPIKQFVQEKGGTVQALFLTHTHYDHIYGILIAWFTLPLSAKRL